MEKPDDIAVVEKHGTQYLRAHVRRTDESSLKTPGVFFLAEALIPRAVAATLEHWADKEIFPGVYRGVNEVVGRVDLKKKGVPVKFFLDRGARACVLPCGGADVEIPLKDAVCTLVAHLAEHPAFDLSGHPQEFVESFKGSWRKLLHKVSPVVPA